MRKKKRILGEVIKRKKEKDDVDSTTGQIKFYKFNKIIKVENQKRFHFKSSRRL